MVLTKKYKFICSVLIFTLLISPIMSAAIWASEVEDVSEDHWAYEGVKELIDRGYLSLYADDTFRGDQAVSRYRLADTLFKILTEIEMGLISPADEDLELLNKLSSEFWDELVTISTMAESLSERIEELEERDEILHLRHSEMIDKIDDFEENFEEILSNIDRETKERKDQEKHIAELEENLEAVEYSISNLQDEMIEELKDMDTVNEEYFMDLLKDHEEESFNRIETMEAQIEELSQEFDEYRKEQARQIELIREKAIEDDTTDISMYAVGGLILLLVTTLAR